MKRLLNVALIAGGVFGVALFALSFFFGSYRSTTASMEPTIHLDETMIMRRADSAARRDIIVFRYPLQPQTQMAKRVVAVGGETVEIRDKQLFINGKKAEEPYVRHDDPQTFPRNDTLPEPYRSRDQFGPYTVPPDSYFVLGDNRDQSADSRYWGVVSRANVRGVVILAGKWWRGFRKV